MSTTLKEGDLYPNLKHIRYSEFTMQMHRVEYDWTKRYDDQPRTTQIETVPAVRMEIPAADLDAILEIYMAHFNAASKNPAVQDAWAQYKMLLELTKRYE